MTDIPIKLNFEVSFVIFSRNSTVMTMKPPKIEKISDVGLPKRRNVKSVRTRDTTAASATEQRQAVRIIAIFASPSLNPGMGSAAIGITASTNDKSRATHTSALSSASLRMRLSDDKVFIFLDNAVGWNLYYQLSRYTYDRFTRTRDHFTVHADLIGTI